VPEVLPELSTERLLVMEYINGIKITDREALEQADISPHEVAWLLNDLYADQMLHLGMLHADPHPGPRLVLLDHWSPTSMQKEDQNLVDNQAKGNRHTMRVVIQQFLSIEGGLCHIRCIERRLVLE
jgi:predicted unusual protein kinase regulating ubiquinone biosynthesis (AarF/ABC1/UbiB family)